jgi:hypothetical protein
MHVTFGQAARQSGLSKSSTSRAVRGGKLSAVRSDHTGTHRIEQSELQRYLDATAVARVTAETVAMTQTATPSETVQRSPPRSQACATWPSLLRAELADVKTDRDHSCNRCWPMQQPSGRDGSGSRAKKPDWAKGCENGSKTERLEIVLKGRFNCSGEHDRRLRFAPLFDTTYWARALC